MVIERMFVQNVTTNRCDQFPRIWRLRVWRSRRLRLPGRIRPIRPLYPANTHGAVDEVGISHLATIRINLFLVDEDEAVVLYAVTVSAVTCRRTCRRTGRKIWDVAHADLAL